MAMERIEEVTENLSVLSQPLPKDMNEESLTSESDEDSFLTSIDPLEEWSRISSNLGLQLISHILGNLLPHVPAKTLNSIISKMKIMLMKELEGLDIPFTITDDHIRRTVKAVLKEMHMKMGKKGWIRINFLLDCQSNFIIKCTMKHLQTLNKKNKFRRFFEETCKFRA